jgi:manganese/zinc/iron transport system ATP- binding protein
MNAIDVADVTIRYGRNPAVWDVTFAIPQGVRVAVVGPNGAGKSTLLKGLMGFVPVAMGTVSIFDAPLAKVRKSVSYVPQREEVDWDFPVTALDVVMMGRFHKLGLFKWPRASDRKAALLALAAVDMESCANCQICELSGGQQQRVFLARAILQKANLYLLDEPFTGVDHTTEQVVGGLFSSWKEERKTVVAVHHDLSTVDKYFDWAILLNVGVIAVGPIAEVFTEKNLAKAYGKKVSLLAELAKVAREKQTGVR